MIITRLEQELELAQNRLDRTLKRVASPDEPAAIQGRRAVDEIEGLLTRIDDVLVDAVDRFPTMFDFSGGHGDRPSPSSEGEATHPSNSPRQIGEISAQTRPPSNANGQTQAEDRHQQPFQSQNKANNRSAAQVAGIADVDVTVSERKRMIDVGGETTFQIRLRNYGTKEVTHLGVTAKLSQNLEYVSAGVRSHDVGVRFRSQDNAVHFQRIATLGPGKEIILGVTARVTGSAPKLATCRVSVTHDELPEGDKLEDMAGVKVMNASRQ